jgi:hypothetical protein
MHRDRPDADIRRNSDPTDAWSRERPSQRSHSTPPFAEVRALGTCRPRPDFHLVVPSRPPHAPPIPGASRIRSIRSRIAANNLRGAELGHLGQDVRRDLRPRTKIFRLAATRASETTFMDGTSGCDRSGDKYHPLRSPRPRPSLSHDLAAIEEIGAGRARTSQRAPHREIATSPRPERARPSARPGGPPGRA